MEENLPTNDRIVEFVKGNLLIVSLILVGMVLAGVGLIQYFSSQKAPEVQFVAGQESQIEKSLDSEMSAVAVDVSGQVISPGVYTLEPNSRIQDALDAAGGLTSKADAEYIAKRLNLAQKVIDGGKIYIPAVGETAQTQQIDAGSSTDVSVMGIADTNGLIDINSATESELDTLPRVGPVTARKIIDGRPYATIEDLVAKKVLGQATFDGLKDRIMVQ